MIRSIDFRAMNTSVTLAAEGERAIDGLYAAKIFINACENRFSRFLPASEISLLNHFAGEWFQVSDDLMDILQRSLRFHIETDGLFDPAILPQLKEVGYDRSMDEIRAHGVRRGVNASARTSQPAFHEMEFDPARKRVRIPQGMQIDISGIAKGWIIQRAAELLNTYVDTCAVSAGGDIQFIGTPNDGMGWEVYIEDPHDENQYLAKLHLSAGGVATSSITKRTWRQGDVIRHHLIDPRTGEPAKTEWLSVTVVSPDVITSDIYAKAILIGGKEDAERLLKTNKDIAYIAVDPHGNLLGSPNYKENLNELTTNSFFSSAFAD